MTAQQMWMLFPHPADATYEAWAFCGGGEVGDRLAALTLAGTKTATSSARIAYELEHDPLPHPGGYSVILLDNGDAVCVIRDTKVSVVPFDEVGERHAYLEGEGDRSLAYWRQVHREAFAPDYEQAGLPFDEHGLCVLEEFEVVYPPKGLRRSC
ncbi:MAG: ASCH domain-containing protein [Eubacteriales bacterium]|nr:ASCH domain-containing protein [Eubacteriales bacterium]